MLSVHTTPTTTLSRPVLTFRIHFTVAPLSITITVPAILFDLSLHLFFALPLFVTARVASFQALDWVVVSIVGTRLHTLRLLVSLIPMLHL